CMVEARPRIHWREVDRGLRQAAHPLLTKHEPPEFTANEIIHVASAGIVQALTADGWRSLERVLADIDNGRHVGRILFSGPPVGLLEELELEVIVAKGAQMRAGKIENLMAN